MSLHPPAAAGECQRIEKARRRSTSSIHSGWPPPDRRCGRQIAETDQDAVGDRGGERRQAEGVAVDIRTLREKIDGWLSGRATPAFRRISREDGDRSKSKAVMR
jgi:hypothetical protein